MLCGRRGWTRGKPPPGENHGETPALLTPSGQTMSTAKGMPFRVLWGGASWLAPTLQEQHTGVVREGTDHNPPSSAANHLSVTKSTSRRWDRSKCPLAMFLRRAACGPPEELALAGSGWVDTPPWDQPVTTGAPVANLVDEDAGVLATRLRDLGCPVPASP